jgi:Uma2 family endonuclease
MIYRNIEIMAEMRTLEQWSIDDDGELNNDVATYGESQLEGYWFNPPTGQASENFSTIANAKAEIDAILNEEPAS